MESKHAGFTVIAHRGNQGLHPENTLQAFQSAVDAGFPHCELDVQLTQDGVCIVLHDEELHAVGCINHLHWRNLQSLEVGKLLENKPVKGSWSVTRSTNSSGHVNIPRLEQVLTALKGRAHLHLELKANDPRLPQAVAHLLHQTGWACSTTTQHGTACATSNSANCDNILEPASLTAARPGGCCCAAHNEDPRSVPGVTITSFHFNQLVRSMQQLPGVRHAWLIQDLATPGVVQEAKGAGIKQLCPRLGMTPDNVLQATQQGLTVRAWGLKNPEALLAAACVPGVIGGTVDNPCEGLQVLNSKHAAKIET